MNDEVLKKVHERSQPGERVGWGRLPPVGWTTLVVLDGSSDSIDQIEGFPSIVGLDPLMASPLLRRYLADSKRANQTFERVVTFFVHDELRPGDGYDVEIADWIIEPADVEWFEPCAIGYWVNAFRDSLSAEVLQAVMDLNRGDRYEGTGGPREMWAVRRRR